MKCLRCDAESSEMLTKCEWCGANLFAVQAPQGPPPWPPQNRAQVAAPANPWYMRPWPYAAAIAVALVVIVAVLALGGKGASAYPDLVVGHQPTLLDLYTDS